MRLLQKTAVVTQVLCRSKYFLLCKVYRWYTLITKSTVTIFFLPAKGIHQYNWILRNKNTCISADGSNFLFSFCYLNAIKGPWDKRDRAKCFWGISNVHFFFLCKKNSDVYSQVFRCFSCLVRGKSAPVSLSTSCNSIITLHYIAGAQRRYGWLMDKLMGTFMMSEHPSHVQPPHHLLTSLCSL